MSDSMRSRWERAKLGNTHMQDGKRMCVVMVECDGDPREEVLELLDDALVLAEATEEPDTKPQKKRARRAKS